MGVKVGCNEQRTRRTVTAHRTNEPQIAAGHVAASTGAMFYAVRWNVQDRVDVGRAGSLAESIVEAVDVE